ncbi:MAG TPA: tRNA (guanosine(46)-N7)-methyltransferase TrmB [Stellaceae bacterium]|nr:tRNA (guanosine(46)-N7)-methyltransferase TrmB [Stellaceae bacterium]
MSSATIRAGDRQPQRRLYGRRRGRALRAGQRALIETLLPELRFALPQSDGPQSDGPENRMPLDPRSLFRDPVGDVWLEIGFGGGEHVAFQAETYPDCGIIGCEVFEPGIARLLSDIAGRGLGNVRLFIDDARMLVAALAPQSLGRAFILFPDPWPKERHKKRRIVARETLDHLAAALRDGAELRVATDDPDYAQWIDERLEAHPDFARLDATPRPADWPPTRYEQKAAAQGRAARLFFYRRRPR